MWYLVLGELLGVALLTFVLEYPIMRLSFGKKRYLFINTLLINFITNLILNALILSLRIDDIRIIIILEIFVVISESMMFAHCYNDIAMKKVIVTCFFSNLFSYLVGLIIF